MEIVEESQGDKRGKQIWRERVKEGQKKNCAQHSEYKC